MHISKQLSSLLLLLTFSSLTAFSQVVKVGSGSYTTKFPGVDAANRNGYPGGTPYVIGDAQGKPIPTNDWWSHKVKNAHSDNLFNYPYTMKTVNSGLITTYIPWGVIGDNEAVTVGVEGLNASACNVTDYSDWTVSLDWQSNTHHFKATSGIGMPFLYFEKATSDVALVNVKSGTVTISNEILLITDASSGADFAVYAPSGSTWSKNGNVYTSTLNGENYWSMAFLPLSVSSPANAASDFKKYAYVFPTNTTSNYKYNEATSVVTTNFKVSYDVKEGTDTTVLLGLLPHQWDNLSSTSNKPSGYTYNTVRGELKMMAANSFTVENTFYGILPNLPYVDNYSDGFSPSKLIGKVEQLQNEGLSTWTDSYNEGQMMNKLIQTARIADQIGNISARDKLIATVKERLEDWLAVDNNEVAFLFYYNDTWTAMLGYPAGHGQDNNINDHHFHWGYFIHAAAFLEQYEPGWAAKWGDMINLLVRDAATYDREDDLFPFLRNFSPYAGHCWANGFASFPQGNDQESTSESMQFNSSLIHWGSVTGNDDIRDLGIYLYTTEQTAIEEYWLDINERNFSASQQYSLVSRVWGNSYDNGTFWTADIAASYGIEMYPIHGGSMYLGHDTNYVQKLWTEIEKNTGILKNEANVNLWHDVYWEYLAFINPKKAIELYDSYPDRSLKFGITDAQTYHWLHAMNALGRVDATITANHPIAVTFTQKGETIYTAHNYSNSDIEVTFSDSYVLKVSANSTATSKDVEIKGQLTSDFDRAYTGGSVNISLNITSGTPTKVEFFDGDKSIGSLTASPFDFKVEKLTAGKHYLYAKIYDGEFFNISNMAIVTVGEQLPYLGNATAIPGSFYAGNYDFFEGGGGQGISYNDQNQNNEGDYRENEYVDAAEDATEGKMVGWISTGEWLEYTVNVDKAGYYSLDFRYASGNQSGGGPFSILSDDNIVASNITTTYSGDWNVWRTKTISNIPLKAGEQVLRLEFENGELNIGEFTFTYEKDLDYSQPTADAGANILVQLPTTKTDIDASASTDPQNGTLTYEWTQVYGPSTLTIADKTLAKTSIDGLVEGVYLMKLKVDNGSYSDEDALYIISSADANVAPKVSIYSPQTASTFIENREILIEAAASDLIGTVTKVEFYANNILISTDNTAPFSAIWKPVNGTYELKAIAFDDDNASSESNLVDITVTEAPSCTGTSFNGDYDYKFSPDEDNPTLTFIPNQTGMGSPTCLLYYGTNASALPGYPVTPNVPFKLNAAKGTNIFFYYTYSHPAGGERNTAGNKDNYEIGSCQIPTSINTSETFTPKVYPNPMADRVTVQLDKTNFSVSMYSISGELLFQQNSNTNTLEISTASYSKGVYFIEITHENETQIVKVVK